MSTLAFLSPELAAPEALASPLLRALAAADPALGLQDLSRLGKVELRGDVAAFAPAPGEELLRLTPQRALVLADGAVAGTVERARAAGLRAYDVSGAWAGLALSGEPLMRRLTELDLDSLPTAGALAHVTALLFRDGDRFRIFVPQELGHYLVEVVRDMAEGLA